MFNDGAYIGNWKNDCASGMGRFLYVNQEYEIDDSNLVGKLNVNEKIYSEYTGEWKYNMAHGLGRFIDYISGFSYFGEWRKDLPVTIYLIKIILGWLWTRDKQWQ